LRFVSSFDPPPPNQIRIRKFRRQLSLHSPAKSSSAFGCKRRRLLCSFFHPPPDRRRLRNLFSQSNVQRKVPKCEIPGFLHSGVTITELVFLLFSFGLILLLAFLSLYPCSSRGTSSGRVDCESHSAPLVSPPNAT